jgi:hypothetical protein
MFSSAATEEENAGGHCRKDCKSRVNKEDLDLPPLVRLGADDRDLFKFPQKFWYVEMELPGVAFQR